MIARWRPQRCSRIAGLVWATLMVACGDIPTPGPNPKAEPQAKAAPEASEPVVVEAETVVIPEFAHRILESDFHYSKSVKHSVGLDALVQICGRRDCRSALHEPKPVSGSTAARKLKPDDIVYGLVHHGQARAYAASALDRARLIHDSVAKERFLITHDPGSEATLAHVARVKRKPTRFGFAGLAYHGRALIYDEPSQSLWDPSSGHAVVGRRTGQSLKGVLLTRTKFRDWQQAYPEATYVLPEAEGEPADQVYRAEFEVDDGRLGQDHPVIGLVLAGGQALAIDLAHLRKVQSLELNLEGRTLSVDWADNLGVDLRDLKTGKVVLARQMRWSAWADAFPGTDLYPARVAP